MNFVHATLEVIGAAALLGSIFLLIAAYGTGGKRNSLDKFNENPENYRFSKIRSITRMDSGKPRPF
jgi:hypothetical protein